MTKGRPWRRKTNILGAICHSRNNPIIEKKNNIFPFCRLFRGNVFAGVLGSAAPRGHKGFGLLREQSIEICHSGRLRPVWMSKNYLCLILFPLVCAFLFI
jgi:hypothetical protein